jgi:uncharacterized membrane protein YkvA (DUF1232 family)
MTPEQSIATLQRFVDHYPGDVAAAEAALSDGSTPEAARVPLAAALNYVLDLLDIFPDHYKGLGVADDAIVLRLAARQAEAIGAEHAEVVRLAREAEAVETIFGAELAAALDKYVSKLVTREVRGRTVAKILADKDARAVFSADVARQVKAHQPQPIDTSLGGADRALGELRTMARHALKKEGLL